MTTDQKIKKSSLRALDPKESEIEQQLRREERMMMEEEEAAERLFDDKYDTGRGRRGRR